MDPAFSDDQAFRRVPCVERRLAGHRRFVQPLESEAPTQLAGSAPMIWDLLDYHPSVNTLVPELQLRFTDAPELIANGIRAALQMFIDSSLVVPSTEATS